MAKKRDKLSTAQIVKENWDRYREGKARGHKDYVDTAALNERFYLGGGLQWKDEDREYLESLNRPVMEVNHIFPAVNTARGMQLKSRVDIAFKPRGAGADEEKATTLSKVVTQICDDAKYNWYESTIWEDGLIEQRGFLDIRMEFDDNLQGDVVIKDLDPRDVIPDPAASSYDTDRWNDVILLRYMTTDDILETYGEKAADDVTSLESPITEGGDDVENLDDRMSFGDNTDAAGDKETTESGLDYYLVIERQVRRMNMEKVIVHPRTGRVFPLDAITPEQQMNLIIEGGVKSKRMVRRVRWVVTTASVLLHDEWSPYKTFSIIPFFPYFRRGKTRGMVDNLRSPNEMFNKLSSQFVHIVSGIANTGYQVEQGSLTNMTTRDLGSEGSKTGLVIEYAKGSTPPKRIEPVQMPVGIDRMLDRTELSIKTTSGISDAMQGLNGPEVSGVAIESKQYQGQAQLGGPLDNLARTRFAVARKLLELIQGFYTEPRVMMITDSSPIGKPVFSPLEINQETPEGDILNDLSIGEYDVVVSDAPATDTYLDNQFNQAMEMRDKGIAIPDAAVITMSSLSKKHEIVKMMEGAGAPPPDPLNEAKAALAAAQANKVKAETVGIAVDSVYSATQAAGVIAATPQTALLADDILLSTGFEDKNAAPIVPQLPDALVASQPGLDIAGPPDPAGQLRANTNPMTPVPPSRLAPDPAAGLAPAAPLSPAVGQAAGIETQRID